MIQNLVEAVLRIGSEYSQKLKGGGNAHGKTCHNLRLIFYKIRRKDK